MNKPPHAYYFDIEELKTILQAMEAMVLLDEESNTEYNRELIGDLKMMIAGVL